MNDQEPPGPTGADHGADHGADGALPPYPQPGRPAEPHAESRVDPLADTQPYGAAQEPAPASEQPGHAAPGAAGQHSAPAWTGDPGHEREATRPLPFGPVPFGAAPAGPAAGDPAPVQHGRRLPAWTWPAVAALALVVGLVGGAMGAALYESSEDPAVSRGLSPSTTRTAPPISASNQSVSAVAEELLPSTVQILAGFDGSDGGATGSGFVLDTEGHVITNNHVVADAADDGTIDVVDSEGTTHTATVVGRSSVYDLAVLKVEASSSLRPASLGSSTGLRVGEPVVAFGAPLGLSQTVTSGIVSALNRPVTTGETDDTSSFINAVQTDAAINPGNSGGPLVNLAGQVVGVNSAIATTGGFMQEAGNIGVGFAIPIEQVETTAQQILSTGEARYPVIGATVQTGESREFQGARIDEVRDDTPAQDAGLRSDDLVVAVNGQRVTDGISLIVSIRTHQPGETLEFTVVRGGKESKVKITLDSEVG
ncbi:trypsin-like peptidase domain-containing protein [Nocardioides sp. 616]|uniref:S1C family serine protease n=1 Tax=Nocardioides sp. 616 TaxID=2268090 RepID=UPI000CE34630|nr:trypsin-like peptidase domain-containing protein [Nocardioides sp. 616]